MAKTDVTKTELVWPGKYNEDGTRKEVPRVSLPFQVIETINESRATREAQKGGVQGTHVTRKRLLGIENCKPFEVLNLGKYERQ